MPNFLTPPAKGGKTFLNMEFTQRLFLQFIESFSALPEAYVRQMAHFWRWLKDHQNKTYSFNFGPNGELSPSADLTLKGVTLERGQFYVYFEVNGKKPAAKKLLFQSPFFYYYKAVNRKAGTWIAPQ